MAARALMYRVIFEDIVSQIRSGSLLPAERLPSEQELARTYGVSRMTVRQALDLLVADELISRRQGSGTFVRESSRRGRRLTRLRAFGEELAGSGRELTSRTVRAEVVPAPEEIADALEVGHGDPVNRLTRVRRVDDVAAALQDAWVPYALAPGLVRESLVAGSLYRTLAERYGVELRWADQTMTASLLAASEAELLEVDPGGAVLHGVRTTYSRDDAPVEYTYGWTLPEFPLLLRIDAE